MECLIVHTCLRFSSFIEESRALSEEAILLPFILSFINPHTYGSSFGCSGEVQQVVVKGAVAVVVAAQKQKMIRLRLRVIQKLAKVRLRVLLLSKLEKPCECGRGYDSSYRFG